jgi:hypothetical protein
MPNILKGHLEKNSKIKRKQGKGGPMAMIEETAGTLGKIKQLHTLTTESSIAAKVENLKLENANNEIFIDYKFRDRVISVCQLKVPKKSTAGFSSLYRLVGVKYQNKNISTDFIKSSLHQAIQNVILSPNSYDLKKVKTSVGHDSDDDSSNESSSPICVSSFPEDSHIYDQLFDKRVITSFKEIIFKCDAEELSSSQTIDHIPILISIEGNIGAGKSKLFAP